MQNQTKTIIYDFDGTIAKSLHNYMLGYKKALEKCGLSLTDKEVIDECFHKNYDIVCKNLNIEDKFDLFINEYSKHKKTVYDYLHIYPNVIKTLKSLKDKGYKLGLCSVQSESWNKKAIKDLSFVNLFDAIVLNTDAYHKRSFLLKKIIKKLNCTNPIIIGDSDSDLEAANELNIKCVLFYPKENELFYDKNLLIKLKPYAIIKDHIEILEILNKIN